MYLRVSTREQTTENERRELEAVLENSGWELVSIYEDAGVSGSKGRFSLSRISPFLVMQDRSSGAGTTGEWRSVPYNRYPERVLALH